MMSPRWRKVIRDLWDNKSRTALVVVSIAIGVFAFGGLFTTRLLSLEEMNGQFQDIYASHIVMGIGTPFDETLESWFARQDHVVDAQGQAAYSLKLIENGTTHNIRLISFGDFNNIRLNQIDSEQGRYPPGKNELLLERSSQQLVPGLELGDDVEVELANGQRFDLTYAGVIHDLNAIPGTFQNQLTGYVTLRTLDQLGFPAEFNTIHLRIDEAYLDYLEGDIITNLTDIANDLQDDLKRLDIPVGSIGVREVDEHWANDISGGIATILVIVGLFTLVLSGFLVINTITGLLAQQQKTIGIMKIIGASRAQIVGVYLVMVMIFGILALVIAIPAGIGLARFMLFGILASFLNFDIQNFHLPTSVLILQITVALLFPVIAALVPILNGTRISAAEAISDHTTNGTSIFDQILARLRGLSRPVLLSIRNTFRRKGRLLMTMLTLVLAGTLFISIVNVRYSLTNEILDFMKMSDYDIQINLDRLYNTEGMTRRIEELPGVVIVEGQVAVSAQRTRPDDTKGETFSILGIEPDTPFVIPKIQEGQWLQESNINARYQLVVSNEFLTDEPDIELGDIITLEVNNEQENWQVIGIVLYGQPIAYAHYKDVNHVRGTPDQTAQLLIRTESSDQAFIDETVAEILRYLDVRDIGVNSTRTRADVVRESFGGLDVLIFILFSLSIIVAAVGGLGLAGTMSLNVLERTREIGVMRAVGAGTMTIRGMYIGEGILIGVLSGIIALPLSIPGSTGFGSVLGAVIISRDIPYAPTLEGPVIWFIIVTIIATVASVMPAQRASQISIREALAYE